MKIPRKIKKIWDLITTVAVVFAVMMAILLVGVRLVGIRPFIVLSGSMEPTYKTGSLIYVKEVEDKSELKVGDPIIFVLSDSEEGVNTIDGKTLATHRIIEIVYDEENPEIFRFRTKGDNNDSEDSGLVHPNNVVGKPIFTIPYLGYVSNYVQSPPGLYVTIAVCAMLLLVTFIPDLFKDDKKKKEEKENGKEAEPSDKTEK